MSLSQPALQSSLLILFESMNNFGALHPGEDPNQFLADGMESAINAYLTAGRLQTVDVGTQATPLLIPIPSNIYNGQTVKVGALRLSEGFSADLKALFDSLQVVAVKHEDPDTGEISFTFHLNDEDESDPDELTNIESDGIARVINSHCSEEGAIQAFTEGNITIPGTPPTTIPADCPVSGTFISSTSLISAPLKTYFASGGLSNLDFAIVLSTCIDSYFRSGSVNVIFAGKGDIYQQWIMGTGVGALD